jgi:hypothetical protein
MPTGTRSSINANSETKPRIATALVLGFLHQLRLEDQPVGANGDQQHSGNVAGPGNREKRPGRQSQVKREHVVVIGAPHLVE